MAKLTSKASRIRTHVRVRRKVKGTTERPRLAVNFSGHHIRAQVIDDVTGRTLVSAFTTEKSKPWPMPLARPGFNFNYHTYASQARSDH